MIIQRWSVLLSLLLSACATIPPPRQDEVPAAEPRASWERVLEKFVDTQGRVDFAGLAADRADLDRYVAWVYAVSPASQPSLFPGAGQVLAYHLNAYNALAMYSVLADGIPDSLSGFKKVRFFALRKIVVGGETLSLRSYENDIIRKLGDPRVHFALNCMSRGCPRLPRVPFDAATLDQQLEREARNFFSEPRNARADTAARKAYLSEILDFYTADFLTQAPSLIAYANRYRHDKLPEDYAVAFTPYDWTINRQPARQ